MSQVLDDKFHWILGSGLMMDLLPGSAAVHQYHARASRGNQLRKIDVKPKPANIVYDLCPGLNRTPGNNGVVGIDGNRNSDNRRESLNHWDNPTRFLLVINCRATRSCGFSADVENI